MTKVKEFLLEIVTDFFAYWLPCFLLYGVLLYKDNGFTPDQCNVLTAIIFSLTLFSFWRGKDNEERFEELEKEIAILKGDNEVM